MVTPRFNPSALESRQGPSNALPSGVRVRMSPGVFLWARGKLWGEIQKPPKKYKRKERGGKRKEKEGKPEKEDGGFIQKKRADFDLATQKKGKRTCLEDALMNSQSDLGVKFTDMYKYDLYKNTPFTYMKQYLNNFKIDLERVTAKYTISAPAAVSLIKQETKGLFIVQLQVMYNNNDKEPDLHCVYCNSTEGKILDNSQYSKPLFLETKDRQFSSPPTQPEKEAAYMVWRAAISSQQLKVSVKNVYEIVHMPLIIESCEMPDGSAVLVEYHKGERSAAVAQALRAPCADCGTIFDPDFFCSICGRAVGHCGITRCSVCAADLCMQCKCCV